MPLQTPMPPPGPSTSLRVAGLLLGAGLGGSVDGFALHQIAQWHNMLSAVHPPTDLAAMRLNMTADGWFHAGVWVLTVAGVLLLYDAASHEAWPPPRLWFVGTLLVGAGLFNLVEGVGDHLLLDVHHVRDVAAYDWALLVVGGAGPVVAGWMLTRAAVCARP